MGSFDVFDGLSPNIERISQYQQKHFSLPDNDSSLALKGDMSTSLSNVALKECARDVLDQTEATLDLLRSISSTVQLHVPKIEDGNNFGVGMQWRFIGSVQQKISKISPITETIFAFEEKRLAIVEKLSDKVTIATSSDTISKAIGPDAKLGTTAIETRTLQMTSGKQFQDELVSQLEDLDKQIYLKMKASLSDQQNSLATIRDFIMKNEERLKHPRGYQPMSSSFTMQA